MFHLHIIMFSQSFEEQLQRFAQKKVLYLGHVSAEGVRTDPEKTKAVSEYAVPKDVKQLWLFLGLAIHYG